MSYINWPFFLLFFCSPFFLSLVDDIPGAGKPPIRPFVLRFCFFLKKTKTILGGGGGGWPGQKKKQNINSFSSPLFFFLVLCCAGGSGSKKGRRGGLGLNSPPFFASLRFASGLGAGDLSHLRGEGGGFDVKN